MTANAMTAELLVEIPRRFPYITCWRANRLDAMAAGRGGNVRRVQAGVDGQGDIEMIIGQSACPGSYLGGRMCWIEVKAGKDRMRPSQWAFKEIMEKRGGFYLVARSVEQCLEDLENEIRKMQTR